MMKGEGEMTSSSKCGEQIVWRRSSKATEMGDVLHYQADVKTRSSTTSTKMREPGRLLSYLELPDYMKDNEYIKNYYRAEWPLKLAFFSLFRWHNETLNVWTHLVGFVVFLGLTLSNLMPQFTDLLTRSYYAAIKMEDDNTMELIHLAIQQLLAQKKSEKENKEANDDDDDDQQLLSRLLLQLESVKKENASKPSEKLVGMKEQSPAAIGVGTNGTGAELVAQNKEVEREEIVKELKQVKRQNSITHWLLSATIFLVAAWQFSEVKLLLKVKNKVTHPFRSMENMITGAQDALKHFDGEDPGSTRKNHLSEPNSQSAFKIPDLPGMDLPLLGMHNGDEQG